MCIALYSPPLDSIGNSVRGQQFCKVLFILYQIPFSASFSSSCQSLFINPSRTVLQGCLHHPSSSHFYPHSHSHDHHRPGLHPHGHPCSSIHQGRYCKVVFIFIILKAFLIWSSSSSSSLLIKSIILVLIHVHQFINPSRAFLQGCLLLHHHEGHPHLVFVLNLILAHQLIKSIIISFLISLVITIISW